MLSKGRGGCGCQWGNISQNVRLTRLAEQVAEEAVSFTQVLAVPGHPGLLQGNEFAVIPCTDASFPLMEFW